MRSAPGWGAGSGKRGPGGGGANTRSCERRRRRGRTGEEMAAPVEVRAVKETDATALVPLFRAFFGDHFGEDVTAETVSRGLRRGSRAETFLVAVEGARMVGFTSLRVLPAIDPTPYAEVTDLFVAEGARRPGIGAAFA